MKRSLVIAFLAVFTAFTGGGAEPADPVAFLVKDDNQPGLSAGSTWHLASGSKVELKSGANGSLLISAGDGVVMPLEDDCYVESVQMDKMGLVAVAHVNRLDESYGGVFYSRLIVILDRPSEFEECIVKEVLSRSQLKSIDGRSRRVITLGSIDDFPLVDVFMAYDELPTRPTAVLYEWQRWDAMNISFIEGIESKAAEERLKAAKAGSE